jgi:hypothetical protein
VGTRELLCFQILRRCVVLNPNFSITLAPSWTMASARLEANESHRSPINMLFELCRIAVRHRDLRGPRSARVCRRAAPIIDASGGYDLRSQLSLDQNFINVPDSDLAPLARWFIMARALATVAICVWMS